jgi:pyruvate/2-oxoglutarate dehydrogenase complex dihydrolipoamide acyltransferase (E2) component
MDRVILAAVQREAPEGLFVHHLLAAIGRAAGKAKPAAALSLRIARAAGAPFWLADLPEPVFTTLLRLSSAKAVSFAPVSAMVAKLEFAQSKQPFPLISLATAGDAGATFFLPMRLVLGAPPGSGGFTLVSEGSRFDWHGAQPAKAPAAKAPAAKAPAAKAPAAKAPAAKAPAAKAPPKGSRARPAKAAAKGEAPLKGGRKRPAAKAAAARKAARR